MTKQARDIKDKIEAPPDENIELLYDHIRLTFIGNARQIAESQKPEALLKMIQSCKEIQPVDRSNQELWKIVQQVRQEVLGGRPAAERKAAPVQSRRKRRK